MVHIDFLYCRVVERSQPCCQSHLDFLETAEQYLASSLLAALDQVTTNVSFFKSIW